MQILPHRVRVGENDVNHMLWPSVSADLNPVVEVQRHGEPMPRSTKSHPSLVVGGPFLCTYHECDTTQNLDLIITPFKVFYNIIFRFLLESSYEVAVLVIIIESWTYKA